MVLNIGFHFSFEFIEYMGSLVNQEQGGFCGFEVCDQNNNVQVHFIHVNFTWFVIPVCLDSEDSLYKSNGKEWFLKP